MQRSYIRTHLRKHRIPKLNVVTLIISAAALGYIMIFALISLLSLVASKVAPDNSVISVFTAIALAVGAYTGGYISAKHRRRNGLLMGLCCGLFMFLIILVIGLFISGKSEGFSASIKLFITLIAAGIGGIIGVNSSTFR